MENSRPTRLSSLRKAGSGSTPVSRVPQRTIPPRPVRPGTAPQRMEKQPSLAGGVITEAEDYVSPLSAPAAEQAPRVPKSSLTIPSVKVKPKTNAPKKRGRPAGTKNAKKRDIVLTATDSRRFYMLMIHGWMTYDHLAFLTSMAPTSQEPRIRQLIAAGYIDSHRVEGRAYLYLTAKAFKWLENELGEQGIEAMPFYTSRRNIRPSTHDLKVITVCAALMLGEETFYALSNREVDFLNKNKEAFNLRVQKSNRSLHAQQKAIISHGGARNEDEQAILDTKPKTYKTQAFDYQTPHWFAPGIITAGKPLITESQINESNKRMNRSLLEQFREANGYNSPDSNPARTQWAKTIDSFFNTDFPVRQEGDLRPLTGEEHITILSTLGKPENAWVFDHMNEQKMSKNPHLWARGTLNKTHRPDGVIVLPHIKGRDGFVRGGCVAIEVEEHIKSPAQTIENMVALFDHPLYDKAIYYVPDGAGANNIRKRMDAVEKELKNGYLLDDHYPLREAMEKFFVVVRMDEDYYLSYRSSTKGEWG